MKMSKPILMLSLCISINQAFGLTQPAAEQVSRKRTRPSSSVISPAKKRTKLASPEQAIQFYIANSSKSYVGISIHGKKSNGSEKIIASWVIEPQTFNSTFLYGFTNKDLNRGNYSINMSYYPSLRALHTQYFPKVKTMMSKDYAVSIDNLPLAKNNYYALAINPNGSIQPLKFNGEFQIRSETSGVVTKMPRATQFELEPEEKVKLLGPSPKYPAQ